MKRILPLILAAVLFCAGAAHAGRFTDNVDGTITDTRTGLMWPKDAGCLGRVNWQGGLV
ncbi:MAG: hypothetical protein HZA01_15375 [Nitrospinae bacterium]|nr:hypothetical protein [Nitrospinota bacterium]